MNSIADAPKLSRSIGLWMAVLMIASQLVNAVRAFTDPAGFATYMGLPLFNAADVGFVAVYGLRALFMALFAAVLIYTRKIRALSLMALVAVVMPIGDAWLVARAGAPAATVARHVVIGLFLIGAWFFLRRWLAVSGDRR